MINPVTNLNQCSLWF